MILVKPKRYTGTFTTLSNAALRDTFTLSDGAFRVWLFLLTQSTDYLPSESKLAKKFGVCEKTMQSRIRELKTASLLRIEQFYNQGSGKSSTQWIVSERPLKIGCRPSEPP